MDVPTVNLSHDSIEKLSRAIVAKLIRATETMALLETNSPVGAILKLAAENATKELRRREKEREWQRRAEALPETGDTPRMPELVSAAVVARFPDHFVVKPMRPTPSQEAGEAKTRKVRPEDKG